ncbi:MAG: hypothetical protein RJA66_207 [Actinomycetota bacterium]|jgi:hypothetical protein
MNEQRIEPVYSEWVVPNWTSYIPLLAIYPTLWLTFLPIDQAVGIWSGIALTGVFLFLMLAKSARIKISNSCLAVANAEIERSFISGVEVVAKEDAFVARGRDLDPRAWIHFQGSVKTLVRVSISDPNDPTPYWLFSTRNPEKIKKSLGY